MSWIRPSFPASSNDAVLPGCPDSPATLPSDHTVVFEKFALFSRRMPFCVHDGMELSAQLHADELDDEAQRISHA
jgi:hypothetical protein